MCFIQWNQNRYNRSIYIDVLYMVIRKEHETAENLMDGNAKRGTTKPNFSPLSRW